MREHMSMELAGPRGRSTSMSTELEMTRLLLRFHPGLRLRHIKLASSDECVVYAIDAEQRTLAQGSGATRFDALKALSGEMTRMRAANLART